MIKGINEWKTLTKHISCEYKCKFDGIKWNSNQSGIMINVDVNVKNSIREKDHIWNPTTCSCKNGKYLANIMDDSVISCDEIIASYNEETKTVPVNINEEKLACKTQNFYILLAFLSITIALMIAVSIYCYLIKYQAKQKHSLQFHDTNNELREVLY